MATLELDPLFTRALKLLHSKSRDSEYQLRQMVEDVIAQRKGHPVKHDLSEMHSEPKKSRLDLFSTFEKEEKMSKEKDREAEKEKEKEKLRKERDLKDKEDKERRERISAEKAAASAEKAAAAEKAAWKAAAKERESPDSSDDNMDTDGFAVDLGIACNVCQQFEVTSGNQLIECQECHNLYHQECHKPPVIGQDVNDPRFVWYCTRCVKNLEKMATKPPKPIKSSSSMENSKSSLSSSSGSKSSRSDSLDIFPFRRVESKIPPSSLAAKPMSGLVSLAANLSGKTTSDVLSKSSLTKSEQTKHSSSSSSSSSKEAKSSSSGPKLDLSEKSLFAAALTMGSKPPSKGPTKTSSSIQMANADKRLQMMKKKAAAKLQEKRAFLK